MHDVEDRIILKNAKAKRYDIAKKIGCLNFCLITLRLTVTYHIQLLNVIRKLLTAGLRETSVE